MKLSHIILATLIIGGMVAGSLLFINEMSVKYDADVDVSGFETGKGNISAKFDEVTNTSEEMRIEITTMILPETETSSLMIPYKMIKIAWQGILLVIGSMGVLFSFFIVIGNNLSTSLYLPAWTFTLITSIIIVIIMIILIESFIRWRLQS